MTRYTVVYQDLDAGWSSNPTRMSEDQLDMLAETVERRRAEGQNVRLLQGPPE